MDITLREFTRDDIPQLIGWVNPGGPDFFVRWAGTAFDYPLTEAQLEAHLADAAGEEPERRVFAAVDAATGQVVGHAELSRIDRQNRSATISRLLVGEPSARGKGAGREIVSRVLDIAFGEMSLHRVDLYVLEFHVAALSMYKALGFKTEGHLVEARRAGDRYWNAYYMAMLEEQWPGTARQDPDDRVTPIAK
jgi:RimJ/RimL family protein N-acetyltransferase